MAPSAWSKSASSCASADDCTDELRIRKYWPNRYLTDIAGQIVRSKHDGTRFLLPMRRLLGSICSSTRGETRGSGPTSRSRSPELKDLSRPVREEDMRKVKAARRHTDQD